MSTFKNRYDKNIKELERLYENLYGKVGLNELLEMLEEKHQARKAELLALDEERERNPGWYLQSSMLALTIYTELFAGNFKGLINKLDYLKKMHITYLHLMPFLKTPGQNNDGGFAVSDYSSVNSVLGTNKELENLADTLRKNGISLCMDFVMNHTSDEHEWAQKAKAGDKDYQQMYFCYPDRSFPDEYEKTVPDVFPSTAPGNFTWCKEMRKWVLTTFYPSQWDLNYSNPEVFRKILSYMLDWANKGIEIFRLDAVPYIWKRIGTTCRNLPEVHTIIRMIRLAFEIVSPSVILKGEVVMEPQRLAAYFGSEEQPECHLLYGVSSMVNIWGALSSQDTRLLEAQTENILSLPANCKFVNYVRCHDDIGWGFDEVKESELGIDPLKHKIFQYQFYEGTFPFSYSRGQLYNFDPKTLDARSCGTTASLTGLEEAIQKNDERLIEKALKRLELIHAVIFALPGIPLINSGDEIGQLNDYEYIFDKRKKDDSRYLHRSRFRWDNATLIDDSNSIQGRIFLSLQKLRMTRALYPEFNNEASVSTWHTENRKVFALKREINSRILLCVFNFSDNEEYCRFNYFTGLYKDINTNRTVEPGMGFTMQSHEYLFLENMK